MNLFTVSNERDEKTTGTKFTTRNNTFLVNIGMTSREKTKVKYAFFYSILAQFLSV